MPSARDACQSRKWEACGKPSPPAIPCAPKCLINEPANVHRPSGRGPMHLSSLKVRVCHRDASLQPSPAHSSRAEQKTEQIMRCTCVGGACASGRSVKHVLDSMIHMRFRASAGSWGRSQCSPKAQPQPRKANGAFSVVRSRRIRAPCMLAPTSTGAGVLANARGSLSRWQQAAAHSRARGAKARPAIKSR